MRLGILGGSFDPVHYAHLLLAECCLEACPLDQVWFMPASQPPHKSDQKLSDDRHRVEMLKLAIGGHPDFRVCEMEIERGGISFTIDTLRELNLQFEEAELFFLMGADSLGDLPKWRMPEEICKLATPVVVERADWPAPDFEVLAATISRDRLREIRQARVEMPLIQLSSRDMRARVASGQSIRFRTPRAVETYIQTHRLYK